MLHKRYNGIDNAFGVTRTFVSVFETCNMKNRKKRFGGFYFRFEVFLHHAVNVFFYLTYISYSMMDLLIITFIQIGQTFMTFP